MQTIDDIALKTDPEISGITRKQTPDEREELKASILSVGEIIEPISYWLEEGVLLDGRNRMEIWLELDGIPAPQAKGFSFKSKEDAIDWVISKQMGRRNLNPEESKFLLGFKSKNRRSQHGGQRGGSGKKPTEKVLQNESSVQNEHLKRTTQVGSREEVAKEEKVSVSKVRRAEKYYDDLRSIAEVNLEFVSEIRSGDRKIPEKIVSSVAALPKDKIGKAIVNLKKEREWNHGIEVPESNGKPKKPEKPIPLIKLEQAERLFGDVSAAVYIACQNDPSLDKAGWDRHAKGLVEFLRREAKKVKLCK